MHCQIAAQESRLSVDLWGKMYIQDISSLHEKITNYINTGSKCVTLDLSKVTYMDSSGLSLLVTLHKETINSHGNLTIKGATGVVGEIIKRTHLNKVLNVH